MKWTVVYRIEGFLYNLYPVEVEAEDESSAIMRAGMKREEQYGWFWKMFYQGQRWKYPKWERVSVEEDKD